MLRNTERFCYTAEVEEDVGNKATTSPLNRTIERGTSSPGDFKNGASTSRPSKRVKTEDYERGSKNKLNNTSPINIQSVTKTIEAMEEAIRCLKESAGIEDRVEKKWHSSLVQWTDIAHLMPPKEDCEMIIDYFFSDVSKSLEMVNKFCTFHLSEHVFLNSLNGKHPSFIAESFGNIGAI